MCRRGCSRWINHYVYLICKSPCSEKATDSGAVNKIRNTKFMKAKEAVLDDERYKDDDEANACFSNSCLCRNVFVILLSFIASLFVVIVNKKTVVLDASALPETSNKDDITSTSWYYRRTTLFHVLDGIRVGASRRRQRHVVINKSAYLSHEPKDDVYEKLMFKSQWSSSDRILSG